MSSANIITLSCPSCGAQVKVPEDSNRFTCGYCGNAHILQIAMQPAEKKAPLRARVTKPDSVQIVKDGLGAMLVQRWFSAKYIFTAVFSVVWVSFLIVWYSISISGGAPVVFLLFPIIHVAVGVFMVYTTLAGFLNRTHLELTQDKLSVWFDPLPWPGEKVLNTADIKQLYCKERVSYTRKGGTRRSYELHALKQDDQDVKLVSGLDSPDVAQFFEQQLETWLRIEDQPVEGEMR